MPAEMFYESDADLSLLEDKTIGIIGYGSQGHAHALNCKDNGLSVMVGLYEGSKSREKAEADGLRVGTVAETAEDIGESVGDLLSGVDQSDDDASLGLLKEGLSIEE